ncbi:MAG: PBP1A family penicillin-binding protein [Bacteroidetes bacterium]|nr:PBP1A family penicillin-binding protein [Bacteroidota bacterium]
MGFNFWDGIVTMTVKRFLLLVIGAMLIGIIGLTMYIVFFIVDELPSFEQLENPPQELATRVFSADGKVLDMFYIKKRTYIPYDSIPEDVTNALISTEDRAFYDHWGIHPMRILKAFIKNIIAFRAKEGASTLSQQLARNLFLNREVSIRRKLKEAITAIKIEQTYTKKEILELYCNTVYFGKGAYGVQVASELYFKKNPKDLTTAECAYLIALLKGPENYSAIGNYEKALKRRNLVLSMMADMGYLEEQQYYSSIMQPIFINPGRLGMKEESIAPHFVEMVRQALENDDTYNLQENNLYRDGLVIFTTLDTRIQKAANEAVKEHLAGFQDAFRKNWSWSGKEKLLTSLIKQAVMEKPEYLALTDPAKKEKMMKDAMSNSAFVDTVKRRATTVQTGVNVIDPKTGHIVAMVGSSPEGTALSGGSRYTLNHAVQIKRQPGSSFKPFVYASAMLNGLTPESSIESGPFTYTLPSGGVWSPSGSSSGPISLANALRYSINTVAARLITEHTSPSEVIALAHRMGIKTSLDPFPTLALGAEEVTPLEMTSAFGTFLNHGINVEPSFIQRIEDKRGKLIYQKSRVLELVDALNPGIAKSMIKMMRGVVTGGTASSVKNYFSYDAAGKTGTTNNYADAWFVGFTPQLTAGVWVGFDDQRIKFTGWYGQGGKAAAPIWGRMMQKVYNTPGIRYRERRFSGIVSPDSTELPSGAELPVENRIPTKTTSTSEQ